MRLQLQENLQKASLGYALTSNQQFFRSSPVTPPVTGKITITGGVGAGLYTDLANAIAYINGFTSATVTDATLVGDVFKFTVPAGSDFSNAQNVLYDVEISAEAFCGINLFFCCFTKTSVESRGFFMSNFYQINF
jgi:hypothetical protein